MSAPADVVTRKTPSLSSLLQRQGVSRSRTAAETRRSAAPAQSNADVVQSNMVSMLAARDSAASGQGLMHLSDGAIAQAQQNGVMQQEVVAQMPMPGINEQNALAQAAELAVMSYLESNRMQLNKFKAERAKRDARYATDERHGLVPGKAVAEANKANTTA